MWILSAYWADFTDSTETKAVQYDIKQNTTTEHLCSLLVGHVEVWKGRFSSSQYKLQIKLSLQMFWVSSVKPADHSCICPDQSIPSLLKQCHIPSPALQCLVADIAGDSVVYVLPRCCWLWQPPAGVDWWYCNFNLSALIWQVWSNIIWDPEALSKKLLERSFILISFCYSFAFFILS